MDEVLGKRFVEGSSPTDGEWLIMEKGLYLLLMLIGGALRLSALGQRPLSREEAELAYQAWRFCQGLGGGWGGSPLLFHTTVLSFLILGAGDAVIRLFPALVGTGMIGLPYLLRPRLGRWGALMASALIAFSPSYILFSRTLGGDIVVAAGTLAFLAGLLRLPRGEPLEESTSGYTYLALGGLALALVSGGGVYTTLLVFVGFIPILMLSRPPAQGWRSCFPRYGWRNPLVFFVVLILIGSTGGFFNPQGVQATINLFSGWLSRWGGGGIWFYFPFLLVAYEPLILLLGLAGAWWGRRQLLPTFLAYWFGANLILQAIMGRGSGGAVLSASLPLILLAGVLTEGFIRSWGGRLAWSEEGIYLALSLPVVAYLFLQWGGYSYLEGGGRIFLGFAALFLLVTISLLFGFWLGRGVAIRGGTILLMLVLGALTLHTGWRLNYHMGVEPLMGEATSSDVRVMVGVVEDLSNQRERDRRSVAITVVDESPIFSWYLRDFPNAVFIPADRRPSPTPVIITPDEGLPLPDYRGERFRLSMAWRPQESGLEPFLNWYLFGENPCLPQDVVMWVSQA